MLHALHRSLLGFEEVVSIWKYTELGNRSGQGCRTGRHASRNTGALWQQRRWLLLLHLLLLLLLSSVLLQGPQTRSLPLAVQLRLLRCACHSSCPCCDVLRHRAKCTPSASPWGSLLFASATQASFTCSPQG